MKWAKAPQEMKDLLASAMKHVECEQRLMFGYPAYFINRNMFAGLFQDRLFLRLSQETLARLAGKSIELKNLEPMPGRPMKDYFVIPPEILTNSSSFARLVEESAAHSRKLAPKSPRKARRKKPAE